MIFGLGRFMSWTLQAWVALGVSPYRAAQTVSVVVVVAAKAAKMSLFMGLFSPDY
jgi:hypothetical protein